MASERAIATARESGATFVEGIAAVGRLTSLTRAGRSGDALRGYGDLIDYWDRTHGWVQQWTTLRNLASLLYELGDQRSAAMLALAADAAPDAPALADSERDSRVAGAVERLDRPTAEAVRRSGRSQVLVWARDAIDGRCRELDSGHGRP
jgi:hypothetical protein